jgi:AbrB family looped-hinge helix DNA binding protein
VLLEGVTLAGGAVGLAGTVKGMRARIDSAGRVVVPKVLRDALGLVPGTMVDISCCGAGLLVVPVGRTARSVDEGGVMVATGETAIGDQDVFGLIDAGRR